MEVISLNENAYQELTDTVNGLVGRKAVTPTKLKNLVKQARYIRQTQGTSALLQFAQSLPEQFFTRKEIEKIQGSREWDDLSNKLLQLLVSEGIITPFEAMFMRKMV